MDCGPASIEKISSLQWSLFALSIEGCEMLNERNSTRNWHTEVGTFTTTEHMEPFSSSVFTGFVKWIPDFSMTWPQLRRLIRWAASIGVKTFKDKSISECRMLESCSNYYSWWYLREQQTLWPRSSQRELLLITPPLFVHSSANLQWPLKPSRKTQRLCSACPNLFTSAWGFAHSGSIGEMNPSNRSCRPLCWSRATTPVRVEYLKDDGQFLMLIQIGIFITKHVSFLTIVQNIYILLKQKIY